jgi:ABC-type branched-subunit amino acid transport system ATPase component
MIHSIKIKGYRAFKNLSVNGLGRINLLVGKNNAGKSSLLEALSLLCSGNNLTALWQILAKRGEQPVIDLQPGRPFQQEVDITHIFTGHQAHIGSQFSIDATNEKTKRSIKYDLVEPNPDENPILFNMITSQEPAGAPMSLKITVQGVSMPPIPLTQRGSLRNDVFNQALNITRSTQQQSDLAQYLTTESLNFQQLQFLWNEITLKPEEKRVVEALKFIDSAIERIAPIMGQQFFGGFSNNRGGFLIKRKEEDPIPIGSLGDGIWRMLALAVILSRTKSGVILIDEIDTGLHYTVMEKMWTFVNEVSKEFETQVFATTHSYDCVLALARICSENEAAKDISIQRIELGKDQAIPFSEAEIKIAAQQNMEIR